MLSRAYKSGFECTSNILNVTLYKLTLLSKDNIVQLPTRVDPGQVYGGKLMFIVPRASYYYFLPGVAWRGYEILPFQFQSKCNFKFTFH